MIPCHRRDAVHRDCLAVLRQLPLLVVDTSQLGGGIPDLLLVYQWRCCWVEVKTRSARLRANQKEFARRAQAPVFCVRSAEEALDVGLWLVGAGIMPEALLVKLE